MRKLPAAAQEERRRVIGLRQAGLAYDTIAAQVGLTRTGVSNICQRFVERGAAGLRSDTVLSSSGSPTFPIRGADYTPPPLAASSSAVKIGATAAVRCGLPGQPQYSSLRA